MTIIDGQLDIFDLLAPEPVAQWSGDLVLPAGDAGTFLHPGDPEVVFNAHEAWKAEHSFDSGDFRAYLGWSTYYEVSGAGSEHHTQLFHAGLHCHHFASDECSCVEWYLSRIYCAGCKWWSGIHPHSTGAVHEHLDHCWPGWRDLPVLEGRTVGYEKKFDFPDDYPKSFMVAGAPMLDCRGSSGTATRDVPGANPFGGYKVAVVQECKQHNQKGEK